MNYTSLATKYRPQKFEDVVSQIGLTTILNNEIEKRTFKNCYIFSGSSGCGKTTCARIFANKINNNQGEPIEIDAASNNSVEGVRTIVDTAGERSLNSEYKVYIIDECHMLTTAAWNAMLKLIEEPPKYTIFIFCTTDLQKVPQTIINRCQLFVLHRINDQDIVKRLKFICNNEQLQFTEGALFSIAKMADGSMRQAISYLDKCKDFSNMIDDNSVQQVLGDCSYDTMFKLVDSIVDNNKQSILNIIDNLYFSGTDLKVFISNFVSFILQLNKFCIFKSLDGVNIPETYLEKIKYSTGIEDNAKYFSKLVDKILEIKTAIKNDTDAKTTIEIMLIGG